MICWKSRYNRVRSIKKHPIGDFPLPLWRRGKYRLACLGFASSRPCDETIPYPTKSFCAFDANFLKPLSDNEPVNAPKLASGRSNRGTYMLNLDAFKPNWRCAAAAFGALAIGTISFSGSAAATPLQLFP